MDPLSITTLYSFAKEISKALRTIKNAPDDILELFNEVTVLQDLLSLAQKSTGNASQSILHSEDQEFIKRLIESAREPLNQLNDLIETCRRNTDVGVAERGESLRISLSWFKKQNSVPNIKGRFVSAHHNINTALIALGNIYQQGNNRLILNIHDLVLNQTKENEAHRSNKVDELELCRQISRALFEQMNGSISQSDSGIVLRSTPSSLQSRFGELSEKAGRASDDDESNQDSLQTSAYIRASVSKGPCHWNCPCQCHPRKGMESPRWLTEVLGTLFYSHTGTTLLRLRPCNYPACTQRENASCQLTYHFPRWMVKRAFMFTASYRDLGGISASWSIGLPRTISASHKAWQCIERYESDEFLRLLRGRFISSNDMADDDGTPLLVYALKYRNHHIVGLLLEYGGNPHLVDPRGISACAYAQSSLLIDRQSQNPPWLEKMDLNGDGPNVTNDLCFTPLHHIVIGLEKADLRQQLRLNKADINSSDTFGRSLVHWAVITGNSNAVETLLDHGASATSPDREQMTPLHDIFLAPSSSQLQCAQLLLNAGAEINALDAWGRTPFRIAVGYATISQDLLHMLINEGADINQRDIYSQSPLLKSIQGSNDTTQLLLNHNADTEARDAYGNTPILEAIYRSQPEKLQMLLRHGAKTNEYFELKPGRRARGGPTHVLDFVVWYGSVEIMQVIEESANSAFYLSHPVDAFGLYQDFRLANKRKAGNEESEAFVRVLSRAEHSYEVVPVHSDISAADSEDDDGSSDNEVYEDAHDYIDG